MVATTATLLKHLLRLAIAFFWATICAGLAVAVFGGRVLPLALSGVPHE